MKYVGSKERHAKEILPIILSGRQDGQFYVEPFMGGASMVSKVSGNRIASDAHPHVPILWKAIRDGWTPPNSVSESDYKKSKIEMRLDPGTAFIGFGCSYSGKWFGGYARGNASNGSPRNYADESARAAVKKASGLSGCEIRHSSYDELDIPRGSIIYCDPPYAGTTKYATGDFDHAKFWYWCNRMVESGHIVYVSEYTAPAGWDCVWEKTVNNTLDKNTGAKQGIERLFTRRLDAATR